MPNDNDSIPEADHQEQLEPALPEDGQPHFTTDRDFEAPEPDLLEQEAPVAAVVDERPPPSDDDRLVDLGEEWEPR